ncbi:MAG: type II toxin-antitoxin system HicA family toxin [Bryobacteraceae bacterium]|nr:type II toxin-antitoxin system HicA family toxin [Bryobacteraceae bacterium]
MGKLRVLSGEEVCLVLEHHGFAVVRQKGSHRVLQKHTPEGTISVPVPIHNPVRRGTLLSIIRQPGLPKSIFETDN